MEFTIFKSDFLQALNDVQGVVEKKNVMPVLANVLLDAQEPILKISATDLEVAIDVKTQAKVKKPGQITVLAKKLYDLVKESAGEEITIKAKDNDRVELTSLQNQSQILALPANEYPKLPQTEGQFVTVQTSDLTEILQKVSFAMSTDETRYHLNGVYVDAGSKGTIFVATDGHRLSMVESELSFPKLQNGLILPRKGVVELKKLIASEKAFEISLGQKHVFARTEKQTLFIRLIDGEFPNYNRVIPQNTSINIEIPREDLIGALRRVSLLSDEYSKGVKLYFCENSLLVNTASSDVGEAKEEIALNFKDNPLEVSFNARYLLDVLSVLKEETVIFGFNDKTSPCVVRSSAQESGFQAVVMPMRN